MPLLLRKRRKKSPTPADELLYTNICYPHRSRLSIGPGWGQHHSIPPRSLRGHADRADCLLVPVVRTAFLTPRDLIHLSFLTCIAALVIEFVSRKPGPYFLQRGSRSSSHDPSARTTRE